MTADAADPRAAVDTPETAVGDSDGGRPSGPHMRPDGSSQDAMRWEAPDSVADLDDLIAEWWRTCETPTVFHDGEHLASTLLAETIAAAGYRRVAEPAAAVLAALDGAGERGAWRNWQADASSLVDRMVECADMDGAEGRGGLSEDERLDRRLQSLIDSPIGNRCVTCGHVKHNDLGYCQNGRGGAGCGCTDGTTVSGLATIIRRILRTAPPTSGTEESGLRADVLAISSLIDGTYPPGLDPEAHRWRRCAKVSEEAGEVVEALLGLAGENPRKGITHDLAALRKELLDSALAALGAVAHIDGNEGDPVAALTQHAAFVVARLRAALADHAAEGES